MELTQLTEKGRRWAEANAGDSVVANVAIHGKESGWPIAFIDSSILVANEEGEKEKVEA